MAVPRQLNETPGGTDAFLTPLDAHNQLWSQIDSHRRAGVRR
jgi:hypothetical protein